MRTVRYIYLHTITKKMENSVSIHNWNDMDRDVLFETLRGDTDRQRTNVTINPSLIARFEQLHPRKTNKIFSGTTLSDALNKGLLLYLKLYEEE